MTNPIPDSCKHGCPPPERHRCDARIVVIGEFPDRHEVELFRPFVGTSGWKTDELLRSNGLKRSDCYFTFAYPFKPLANKIETVPREELAFWTLELHERLSNIADPYVIVPTGNVSVAGLFGKGRKISDWRGSILEWKDLHNRSLKVIPTIHPIATVRQPILTRFCVSDWQKIARESLRKEIVLPILKHIIDPSPLEREKFLMGVLSEQEEFEYKGVKIPSVLAVDVETNFPINQDLTCVGFSYGSGRLSITIPTRKKDYENELSWASAIRDVRSLCGLSIPKVLQNGLFDTYHLFFNGIRLCNFSYDLIEMDHCLDPNDGGDTQRGEEDRDEREIRIVMRSLAVLTSLYTDIPFYKHLSSSPDWEVRQRYNGLDCCATRMIFPELFIRLKERGLI